MDYNSVETALKEKYSTNITSIYIPSIGKSLDFKAITVGEQKTITKLMIDSDDDSYKMYKLLLGLISNNCITEGFNVLELLEVDRIKIIIELYQSNFYLDDIELECEECGCVNKTQTDMSKILNVLNDIDTTPFIIKINDIEFHISYPTVVRMGQYYKYNSDLGEDSMTDIDIYNVFISRFNLVDGDLDVDFSLIDEKERTDLLNILPQDILYGEDGLISELTDKIINVFESMTDEIKCTNCDHKLSGGVSIQDFFI